MVEQSSPLGAAWRPGAHGTADGEAGVRLTEMRPGSVCEVAAWRGEEKAVMAAIRKATGITLADGAGAGSVKGGRAAFGVGPGRFLVVDQAEGIAEALASGIGRDTGTVCDLSHGRTAIRVAGPRAEWVLAKLFALDFSLAAFPVGAGRATSHHDVFAQIQRTGDDAFDIYVYRSFARSFWTLLCASAQETGYTVA